MNTQEATSTYDCKFPGCTNEAKSSRGRYSYCAEHQGRGGSVARTASANGSGAGTVEQRIKSLALTEDALKAKHAADAKEAEFQRTMRDVLGRDESADA